MESDEILDRVRKVMNEPDFRAVRSRSTAEANEGFLDKVIERLTKDEGQEENRRARQGTSSSGSAAVGALSRVMLVVFIVVILILLGLIVWVIMRTVDFSSNSKVRAPVTTTGDKDLAISSPPGELAVNEYERRALDLAQRGDFAGAIRQLLLGSMSWIERKGLIRFRSGLTNRDYLRAVWRLDTQRGAFDASATEFEKVFFGRRTATKAMFEICLQHFRGAFNGDIVISPSV